MISKVVMAKKSAGKSAVGCILVCLFAVGSIAAYPAMSGEKGDPMDILVVVNVGVEAHALSVDVVRDFFLKNKTYWSATNKALALHSTDKALRNDFRDKVLQMSAAEEERYWIAEQVRGKKQEPVAFPNTLKAVFKLKGAVSYVYRKDFVGGVAKVVLVVPAH